MRVDEGGGEDVGVHGKYLRSIVADSSKAGVDGGWIWGWGMGDGMGWGMGWDGGWMRGTTREGEGGKGKGRRERAGKGTREGWVLGSGSSKWYVQYK
jgi:hypothetical protein